MSTFQLSNPSTGTTEDTFTRIEDSDRDAILDRATEAYNSWRTTSVDERARVLARAADLYEENTEELASHIGREMSKLTSWARAELGI
ncbi:MAG: aldehyde dehydrogenase family protein, partial [Corynebacterium variabile]|uniref:aldehyde dehydrogenase family protein n=1 Tax=Corynebacterium variabile TaxID=1727 RepID=UPI003F8E6200